MNCTFPRATNVCSVCGVYSPWPDVPRQCVKSVGSVPQTGVQGVGAHLKALLAGWPFRITATPGCPCNAMAVQMDAWGPDGCEQRMDEIVAHLRDQAAARGLPFLDAAGRLLVRRAIANARRNA